MPTPLDPSGSEATPLPGSCACGETAGRVLAETGERRFGMPGRFRLVRCSACGLVRTDPQPADPAAFYPTGAYYSYQPPPPPSPVVRARFRAAYGLDDADEPLSRRLGARLAAGRLAPGMPPGPPGDVLDVGCGSGAFLLGLREAGWRSHGVELDPGAVAAAHAAGLDDVRAGELVGAGFPEQRFDAVRFWHCLEHVGSPREQLLEARRVLCPGGSLTIGVPNFGSLLSRLAGDRWFYLDVPRHLWHFERTTLRRLAEDCGFEQVQVRIRTAGTPLLGTIDYALGRGERLLESRAAWYAALPVAALLDAARVGDALELTARRLA